MILLPLKWLLRTLGPVCNHSQSAAPFKATLVCQEGNKMAIRPSQSAISLWWNGNKLVITCCLFVITLINFDKLVKIANLLPSSYTEIHQNLWNRLRNGSISNDLVAAWWQFIPKMASVLGNLAFILEYNQTTTSWDESSCRWVALTSTLTEIDCSVLAICLFLKCVNLHTNYF